MRRPGLSIVFVKHAPHRYDATLTRDDGVAVRLVGGGFNRIGAALPRMPHDWAHLLIEGGLAVDDGLWAVLAHGGLFPAPNTTVVAGRQRPHAAAHGGRVAAAHGEGLRRAEVVVRVVADLTAAGRERDVDAFRTMLGDRWALPGVDADRLAAVAEDLRTAARRWDGTETGGRVQVDWPLTPRTR